MKVKFDSENKGVNYSGIFSSEKTVWYPASGQLFGYVGEEGHYWSVTPHIYESGFTYYYTPHEKLAFILLFYSDSSDFSYPRVTTADARDNGNSVRCQKE